VEPDLRPSVPQSFAQNVEPKAAPLGEVKVTLKIFANAGGAGGPVNIHQMAECFRKECAKLVMALVGYVSELGDRTGVASKDRASPFTLLFLF
jgi:hypothetical protein